MIRLFRLFRRKPKLPEILPFAEDPRPRPDIKPLQPKDPDYIVEQREMSEQTGMFYFPWLKKKDDPKSGAE